MRSIAGKVFVFLLFLFVLLLGIDLFLWRPVEPIGGVNPEKDILATLEIVASEESSKKASSKEIELPSALAETIPPVVSDKKKDHVQKAQEALQSHQRKPQDQKRFRIFSLFLAFLGAPLFSVIGSIALFFSSTAESIFVDAVDKLTAHTLFITLPLFTFAGYVLSESKAPERLVRFSRALLGWFPGGTALIVAASCAFFTAFTGASGVTIVALGGLLYPMLIKDKYGENFTLGILTTSGSLGLLFPPSLPLILYAVIANLSMQGMGSQGAVEVKELFIAGLIPGTLLVLIMAGYGALLGFRTEQERPIFSLKELKQATLIALPELLIPAVMVVGYFGGYLQLTEAAAATAFYVVIVESLFYRDIGLKDYPAIFRRSMMLIGAILLILMMAMSLTNLLIMAKVPDQILLYMKDHIDSAWKFLLLLNVFLLMVGCLMDIFSAILVVVPLIIPIAVAFGIDPLHLGVIFLTNLGIGYSTPPVGMNLFISSLRFKESIFKVAYTCLPFLVLLLFVLGIVTYIPALSTYPVKNTWVIWAFFGALFAIFAITYLVTFVMGKKQTKT